jgi:hypothetical protein
VAHPRLGSEPIPRSIALPSRTHAIYLHLQANNCTKLCEPYSHPGRSALPSCAAAAAARCCRPRPNNLCLALPAPQLQASDADPPLTSPSHLTPHTSHLTPHTSHLTPHTSHLTRHTSHVTRHTSHVTRHTSHVTRHTSHVTPHTSHFTPHTSHVTPHTSLLTRHTSHVTRHTSHVTRHTSHVTRHTSHVTRHTSPSALPLSDAGAARRFWATTSTRSRSSNARRLSAGTRVLGGNSCSKRRPPIACRQQCAALATQPPSAKTRRTWIVYAVIGNNSERPSRPA